MRKKDDGGILSNMDEDEDEHEHKQEEKQDGDEDLIMDKDMDEGWRLKRLRSYGILPNIDEDQDEDEKRQVDDKAEDVYEGCKGWGVMAACPTLMTLIFSQQEPLMKISPWNF